MIFSPSSDKALELVTWTVSQGRSQITSHIRYLEVSNKVSNIACRVELGRFPFLIANI